MESKVYSFWILPVLKAKVRHHGSVVLRCKCSLRLRPCVSSASHEIKPLPWDRWWGEGQWGWKSSPVKECPPHRDTQVQLGYWLLHTLPKPFFKDLIQTGDQGMEDGVTEPACHPRPVSWAPEGRRRLGRVGITEDLLPGLLRHGPKGPECTVVWDSDKSLTQSIFLELLRSWPNWNGVFRDVNKFITPGTARLLEAK